jgi:hypothetical protein
VVADVKANMCLADVPEAGYRKQRLQEALQQTPQSDIEKSLSSQLLPSSLVLLTYWLDREDSQISTSDPPD